MKDFDKIIKSDYPMNGKYAVSINKRSLKNVCRMPIREQKVFSRLIMDIRERGPIQPLYPHYGKLGDNKYHCHLGYHWVACWSCEDGKYKVEVYYAGSRENAPY